MRHEMFTEALVQVVEKKEVLSIKTICDPDVVFCYSIAYSGLYI